MPKFLIHRNIPGASQFTPAEIYQMSKRFNVEVTRSNSPIYWVHTYVLDDEIYCVYIARNAALLRDYCDRAGYPSDTIREIHHVIDPLAGMPDESEVKDAYLPPLRDQR